MTIRLDYDQHGEPLVVTLDGTNYTLDELRTHIARSRALTTVAHWLDQELATSRRQRRLLAHWQRYGQRMQRLVVCQAIMLYGHAAFIRYLQREKRALQHALTAPWRPENSATGMQRLAQQATDDGPARGNER